MVYVYKYSISPYEGDILYIYIYIRVCNIYTGYNH